MPLSIMTIENRLMATVRNQSKNVTEAKVLKSRTDTRLGKATDAPHMINPDINKFTIHLNIFLNTDQPPP